MKVRLEQAVSGLGRVHDIVEVSEAYARNYLLPKKIAVLATTKVLADQARLVATAQHQEERLRADLNRLRGQVQSSSIHLIGKANAQGRLFAAIKSSAIIAALQKQLNVPMIDGRCEPDHVKTLGRHTLQLKIAGQSIPITVEVIHG